MNLPAPQPIPSLLRAPFVVTNPDDVSPAAKYLGDLVTVSGTYDPGTSTVRTIWTKTFASEAEVPDVPANLAGFTQCGTASVFFANTRVPLAAPNGTNWVAAWGYDVSGNFVERTNVVEFTTVNGVEPPTVSVPATACMWFAFAPSGFVGPYGEQGSDYRPTEIPIDGNTGVVRLFAFDVWRHAKDPALNSGPGGYGEPVGLSSPPFAESDGEGPVSQQAYDTFGGAIVPETANLNELVGMWVWSGETQGTVFRIGDGREISVPTKPDAGGNLVPPSALYLAFHDGFQWSNNRGVVRVLVQ